MLYFFEEPKENAVIGDKVWNDGSLYESRIAQRSTNAADYDGEFDLTHGSASFAISHPYADQDKVRYFGGAW